MSLIKQPGQTNQAAQVCLHVNVKHLDGQNKTRCYLCYETRTQSLKEAGFSWIDGDLKTGKTNTEDCYDSFLLLLYW